MGPRDPAQGADDQPSADPLETGTTPESDQPNILEESDAPDEHEGARVFDHDSPPVASDLVGGRRDAEEETKDVVDLIDQIDPRLNDEKPPV